jgi:hypothetical protein
VSTTINYNKFRIIKIHVHYKDNQILVCDIVDHSFNTSRITVTTTTTKKTFTGVYTCLPEMYSSTE